MSITQQACDARNLALVQKGVDVLRDHSAEISERLRNERI